MTKLLRRLFRRRRKLAHLDHPAFAKTWHGPGTIHLFMNMGVWK